MGGTVLRRRALMQRSRILVTGGAGFLGSHLTSELVDRGHTVQVIDDLSGGFLDNVDKRARFVQGSVTDEKLVQRVFANGKFDLVFHLAAYAAEGLSHFIKKFNYENNLIGSVNLINASINHGVKCFVFTSSIAVYGKNQVPMTEDITPIPEDPYGIAKLAVEQELRVSQEIFGLDHIIFRPHNVYGERQNIGDRYRNVVGIFMNQIMQGEPMTIFGDGEQTRAFTYVGEVIRIMADAPFDSRARNHVFNIGADNPYTIKELADKVANAMGVSPNVTHLEPRKEVKHAFASHKKLRELFEYEPSVPLEAGLERMAAWARSFGARRSKRFGRVEVAKNMPQFWQNESHSRSESRKDRVSIRAPRGRCEIRPFDRFKS
jgi:UDP-glucose 4-epimerase